MADLRRLLGKFRVSRSYYRLDSLLKLCRDNELMVLDDGNFILHSKSVNLSSILASSQSTSVAFRL
jgi:hypothetical protein